MATKKKSKTSPLSEYQKFLREQIKNGLTIVEANALWNQLKGEEGGVDSAITAKISLEKDLEEHLVRDLNQLEKGLKLYSIRGKKGRQFPIDAGRVDILAKDKDDNLVVVELKAGKANDAVIGQILGYIGCIRETIAKKKQVRGIIVANDFDARLKYAASAIPELSLKKYKVNFTFGDA